MTAPTTSKVRIESVMRTVPDLSAAESFYREALAFAPEGDVTEAGPDEAKLLGVWNRRLRLRRMRLGHQAIDFLAFDPAGRSYPAGSRSSDLWFQHCAIVVGDMDDAHARVMKAGALPITEGGPQRLPSNTGGVTAFKFRDPFGHPLELLAFPAGVGAPVWHAGDPAVFRGIDHTAIAISSTEESRHFYADALGMAVADHSHNEGAEQSRLDAVPNDVVDVTAMTPERAPPHLELLDYRTGTRRSLHDGDAADAAISRTLAQSDDIEALVEALARIGAEGLVHGRWFGRAAVRFTDPDAHVWICRSSAQASARTQTGQRSSL